MKKLALLSVLAPFILACATTPTLKDYQPKSPATLFTRRQSVDSGENGSLIHEANVHHGTT